ncbi:MAG: GlsB/YeaQ/YmgE family stress response membrane protein [Fimbriimonadales bacterium]
MHWIWFIAVGFIAGLLAKAIVPGEKDEPQGFVLTTLLGIGGSVLVGFVLHDLLGWQTGKHFIGTIVGATIGAVVLILLVRKFSK